MKKYPIPLAFTSSLGFNDYDQYQLVRENAQEDSNAYWESVAERIDWFEKWTDLNKTDYHLSLIHI